MLDPANQVNHTPHSEILFYNEEYRSLAEPQQGVTRLQDIVFAAKPAHPIIFTKEAVICFNFIGPIRMRANKVPVKYSGRCQEAVCTKCIERYGVECLAMLAGLANISRDLNSSSPPGPSAFPPAAAYCSAHRRGRAISCFVAEFATTSSSAVPLKKQSLSTGKEMHSSFKLGIKFDTWLGKTLELEQYWLAGFGGMRATPFGAFFISPTFQMHRGVANGFPKASSSRKLNYQQNLTAL